MRNQTIYHHSGEAIVRRHRNATREFIPKSAIRNPKWKLPWYHAINWTNVLNLVCWGLFAVCMVCLGNFVFAPFAIKFVWE